MIDNIVTSSQIEQLRDEVDKISRAVSYSNTMTNVNTKFLCKFHYGTDDNGNIVDMELSEDLLKCLHSALIDDYDKLIKEQKKQEEKIRRKFNETSVNQIKRVKYDNPWTIVFWDDGTVTKSKCHENDMWSESAGFNACVAKRYFQTAGAYNKVMKTYCKNDGNSDKSQYEQGYSDGIKAAKEEKRKAMSHEYDKGHHFGRKEGYNDGYRRGHEDGYYEGFEYGQKYERRLQEEKLD